jgi:hypothetical protein
MVKKIGLSLSFCVQDILRGKVKLEDVSKIIASTKVSRPQHSTLAVWDEVLDRYAETYWAENPDEGERIARQLIEEGRVFQPRLENGKHPYIGEGHWVESESEIVWA